MTTLSGIITPSNVETASSASTLTNKTINGSNNTITNVSLSTGVTGTLPVANGGTGAASLTANNVLLGNGTSALQVVAPGSNGNVLTSNGTTWTSAAAAGGGFSAAQVFTSSGTFTIPAGKTAIKVTLVGGGGGGQGVSYSTPGGVVTVGYVSGTNGGNTTLTSGTQIITTVTAGGGLGGDGNKGVGGTATNGDINIKGGESITKGRGQTGNTYWLEYGLAGGPSLFGFGVASNSSAPFGPGNAGNNYGSGGQGNQNYFTQNAGNALGNQIGGGGGATAFKWLSGLTPGNTLTVTIGSGGAGAQGLFNGGNDSNYSGGAGASGLAIIEY